MSDNPPDLTMVLKQQRQMLDEFADFREQLIALTAICMRVEAAVLAHRKLEAQAPK